MSSSEEDNKVYARKSKVSEQITPSQSTAEGQTRRTTKRRYSNSVERPDSKRAKMNESENRIASKVQEHLKDSIKETLREAAAEAFRAETTEFNKAREAAAEAFKAEASELNKAVNRMTEMSKAMESRFGSLETRLGTIEEESTADKIIEKVSGHIETLVENKIDEKNDTSTMLHLRNIISETERNVIIIGYASDKQPMQIWQEIAEKMKIPKEKMETIHITKAHRLGKRKEKGDDVRPLLIALQSISMKMTLFEHARNLPKGVRIESDIPTVYRVGHAELRKEAKKQRDFHKRKTRISFNAVTLTLSIRESSDEAWMIYREHIPSAETIRKSTIKNTTTAEMQGKKVYRPSPEAEEIGNRLIRIYNMPEGSSDKVQEVVCGVLKSSPLKKKLRNVSVRNNAMYLECQNREAAVEICKECQKSKVVFEGKNLEFSTT